MAGPSPAKTTLGLGLARMRELIAVYVMASGKHGTLYVGVTGDLIYRVERHRTGELGGFTQKYGVKMLVWFETHETMSDAIAREKSLKKYKRE
jgi:putative endonuclease